MTSSPLVSRRGVLAGTAATGVPALFDFGGLSGTPQARPRRGQDRYPLFIERILSSVAPSAPLGLDDKVEATAPDGEETADGRPSAAAARAHLLPFVRRMYPGWQTGPHHVAMAEKIEAVVRGEIDRLMIFTPPRHSKSSLSSIYSPAWTLGNHPNWQILLATYGADLSYKFSRQARNLFTSPDWPFEDVALAADSRSVKQWMTNHEGIFSAVGVRGPATGRGADILYIDDPLKDREQADSETIREALWEWYTDVARTRLQPGGRIILTLTRWHTDDLAGRLLKKMEEGGERWVVLCLPARAEENDPLGRAIDAPLWPEWFGDEALTAVRKSVSARTWAALYQQRPTPDGGAMFKREWFARRYHTLPPLKRVIQSVDGAWKTGVANDYSVIATWGTDSVDYYVVDVWRQRAEYPDLKRAIKDQYNKHHPAKVLIEDTASGQAAIQEFRRETPMPVVAAPAKASKEARAEAVTPICEAFKVVLPDDAEWVDEWVEEHVAFPSGAKDDQVDSTSHALHDLALGTPAVLEFSREQIEQAKKKTPPPLPVVVGRMALPGVIG